MHHIFISGHVKEELKLPSIFELSGYKIYFWSNENNEPIYVHISKERPTAKSTKVWLTKSGGCIVANNNSKIPSKELNDIMGPIASNYFYIVSKWKENYQMKDVKFYC